MTNSNSSIPEEEVFDLHKIECVHLVLQALISFIVMGFCMGQLLTKTANTALYWGSISSIIAWWMPSPGEVAQKRSAIALNSNHDSNLTVNENVPSDPTVITTNSTQNGSHPTLDMSAQSPIN